MEFYRMFKGDMMDGEERILSNYSNDDDLYCMVLRFFYVTEKWPSFLRRNNR